MRKIPRLAIILSCTLPALAACGQKQAAKAPTSPPAATDGAALWRIEATEDGKAGKTISLCADLPLQKAFVRPTPEVGGQLCQAVREPSVQDNFYAVRCKTQGQLFSVESRSDGDLARDFTVDTVITGEGQNAPAFRQVRHYVRVGACPAGWKVGDSAAPGDTHVVNATTHETRALEQPFQ